MSEPAPPRRPRRWWRWLVAGLVSVLVLIGAADGWVVWATRARRLARVEDAPARADALVLGNRVFPGGYPSIELALRLRAGLQLYQLGRARRLIVSGLMRAKSGYDEPAVMAAWLESRGVPARDIVLDRGGYRTAASMADAAAMGVRSLLVVSQPYHLPRALYLARHAGIDAVGVPAREGTRPLPNLIHVTAREAAARAETVVEVLIRGVRGAGPVPDVLKTPP